MNENGAAAPPAGPDEENRDLEALVVSSVDGLGANKDVVELLRAVDGANDGFGADGFGAKKEAVELLKVVDGANGDFGSGAVADDGLGANTEAAGLLEVEFDVDAWGLKENPAVSSFSLARRAASFSSYCRDHSSSSSSES